MGLGFRVQGLGFRVWTLDVSCCSAERYNKTSWSQTLTTMVILKLHALRGLYCKNNIQTPPLVWSAKPRVIFFACD